MLCGVSMLDTVASRVYGAGLKRGRNVRILWAEGRLYVVRSVDDVVIFDTAKPVKGGGQYKAVLTDGKDAIVFQVPSCGSCRSRIQSSAVGQMAQDAILAFGREVAADV